MGGEQLFKLRILSYCNSVISVLNLNVLFHSIRSFKYIEHSPLHLLN